MQAKAKCLRMYNELELVARFLPNLGETFELLAVGERANDQFVRVLSSKSIASVFLLWRKQDDDDDDDEQHRRWLCSTLLEATFNWQQESERKRSLAKRSFFLYGFSRAHGQNSAQIELESKRRICCMKKQREEEEKDANEAKGWPIVEQNWFVVAAADM